MEVTVCRGVKEVRGAEVQDAGVRGDGSLRCIQVEGNLRWREGGVG